MRNIKDNKLLLKIFSALIAIVLWFAITYTEDPAVSQTITDINTVFAGEDSLHAQGLIVMNKNDLPSLSAVIRGNRSKVISSLGVVSAVVDVSRISSAGTHELTLQYRYPQESVMLTKTRYSSIQVQVEKILSRQIPIRVETKESDKASETIIKSESNSETITVRGAQSVVEKIEYALATVDSSDVSVDGTMDYSYKLYDKNDNQLSEENILSKSQNTVLITNTVYRRHDLEVKIVLSDRLEDAYKLKTKKQSISTVTVGIPDDIMYDALPTLYAVLDKELTNGPEEVTLNIDLPENFFYAGDELKVTAECELLPKSVHELEVSVVAEKVPEGKKVEYSPEKIRVLVKCAKEDAASEKITAYIDASVLKEGQEVSIPVKFKTKDDVKIISTHSVTCKLQ